MLPTFHRSQLPHWLVQGFRTAQKLAGKGEVSHYTKTTSPKCISLAYFKGY